MWVTIVCVLNLNSISINKVLVTEFMIVKLPSKQKMSTQRNQQLIWYVFSKVVEFLKKSNTRINTKYSKTNRLQKRNENEYKTNE